MQHTYTNGENAARDAWAALVGKMPAWMVSAGAILGAILGYFLNGHAVVDLVRWLVRVAGYVAESALLLATLYVTVNSVAHTLLTWVMPGSWIGFFDYVSLVAFSLLPELILAQAIKTTIEHWTMLRRVGTWKHSALAWATLYSLPTATFAVMTVATIVSFAQSDGNVLQATGAALTVRVLAGWGYSLVEILFVAIGKRGYVAMLDNLRSIVSELRATIATRDTELTTARASIDKAAQDAQEVDRKHAQEVAALQSTIADLQEEARSLTATIEEKELQIKTARAIAPRHRTLRPVALSPMNGATDIATPGATDSDSDSHSAGYVAIDDGESIAIANGHGATIMATGEPRERIKMAMLHALQNGEQLNYKEIAQVANAGYSTVRKHAQAIIEELTQEIPAIVAPGHSQDKAS